jgi:hypothetical protein
VARLMYGRIIKLADLAIAGKLDLTSFVTQLAESLKELKVQTFKEFLSVSIGKYNVSC